VWDDGSGASGRRRADRDDQEADRGRGTDDQHVVEYDIPTTFLPVQREPMTRPRRRTRQRRPVFTVLVVTAATVSIGSAAGLLMARALDQGAAAPGASVAAAAEATTPAATPGGTGSRTSAPSVPAVRPSSATTTVSRSDPSRTPKPTASSKKPAPSPPSRTATTSAAPHGNAALEAQVLTLVNKVRATGGCKALTSNSRLVLAARRHSQFMADSGKHGHDGIGDGTPQDRIEKAGYSWRGWGENIAWGYRTADSVMDGWMNSAGHRANILNCSYREIGVGVDSGGTNWTQDFGIPG
jgi:uncharacterized protein YkwD